MIKVKTKYELRKIIEKQEIPLNEVDVSSIIDMSYLFQNIKQINGSISNWDVSSVRNMSFMFYDSKLNQDISNWNVSSVTSMAYMFYASKFNQDISGWDVSNVEDMAFMFHDSKFNQDISRWDVNNVRNMVFMFEDISYKYYKENCGKNKRTIYLNHIKPELIHIGCFVGTKEEAIKRISKKYSGTVKEKYIQDVLDVFKMYEKGGK